MGFETTARARFVPVSGDVQDADARVLVETDELILRGGVRARVPRTELNDVRVRAGTVTIRYSGGTLALTLGDKAKGFADRLTAAPRSRLEKMGIAAGGSIVVTGVDDADFTAELRAAKIRTSARAAAGSALIVVGVHNQNQLSRVGAAAKSLAPDGALWVVHPKGATGVKDTAIFAAARGAGLTYVKVARFSHTHTAEKLVVPKAARPKKA
jgi:hypothetical protein